MRHRIFSLILALGALILPWNAFADRGQPIQESFGDMKITYHPDYGVRLTAFGMPISSGGTFYFMKPKWVEKLYSAADNPYLVEKAVIEPYQGGKRIILDHTLGEEFDAPVKGREIITLLPGNVLSVTQEFILTKDVPAIFEWKMAGLNPTPMIGTPYTLVTDQETVTGIIPAEAEHPGIGESTIAKAFRSLTVDSRIGTIKIESTPEDKISLFDYRKNIWASEEDPIFWLGALERELEPGKQYSYTVTIDLPDSLTPSSTAIDEVMAELEIETTKKAQIPNSGQDYILPLPKSVEYSDVALPVSKKTRIVVGSNPGDGLETAVAFLLEDLKTLYGLDLKVVRKDLTVDTLPKNAIVLGEKPRFALASEQCAAAGVALPEHEEGYSIHVDGDVAYVAANTEKGIFYGASTLLQLIQVSEEGVLLKGVDIADYPSLDFRGVHALSGKDRGDEIAKAVRDLLARFKLNSFVWECEYIIWDGHEDIEHSQYAMTKKDAQKVVDACKKYFVEIIPLVQSLGHSEWIFVNDKNLDIAEDPQTPYAYNPTNPDTYKFIFDVYQQAIDFFQPRYFHIGHDEVTMRGRFPFRSKDSGHSMTDLILMDTLKLHDWLKERGIQVMMWGDMFLYETEAADARFAPSLEEAKARRARLPKDIVVTDWHYAVVPPEEYTSIKIWKDMGFETIGAGWYRPENIQNLAMECINQDVMGYLQTTWAGFNFMIDGNEVAWHQYWAYLWAAQYSWSGDTTRYDELPFSAKEKFLDVWFGRKPILKDREGFFVDLSPIANRKLNDDDAGSGWLGYGQKLDFSSFPLGQSVFGETAFQVNAAPAGSSVVLLNGMLNPKGKYPTTVKIDVDGVRASELHFLMNTAFRTGEKVRVGGITVEYTNGTTEEMPLVYGSNIFAYYDPRIGENARLAWEGETMLGKSIYVWDIVWDNPEPSRKIKSISISSYGREAAPVLFGITGVDPETRSKFLGIF